MGFKWVWVGAAAIAAITSGCTVPIKQIDAQDVRDGRPAIGEVRSVEVGGQVFAQRQVRIVRGRKVDPPQEAWIMMFPYIVGGLYARANHGQHYCGNFAHNDLLNRGKVLFMCLTDEEFRNLKVPYAEAEEIVAGPSNIQRVIEYGGRSGNAISMYYKEFTETVNGAFIRPAFTQELKFDLADGPLVGIRGARIEVIEAGNTGMRYRMIGHFPQ